MAWWHESKFGMFVHWGCYSVLGRGEQVLVRELLTHYGQIDIL